MMPVNDAYPVEVLMPAVRRYQETTGRRVSFEYSMVRGVNDSDACARQLADLIRGMGAHVNLIPINPVDGSPYSATDAANVQRFQKSWRAWGSTPRYAAVLAARSAPPAASCAGTK